MSVAKNRADVLARARIALADDGFDGEVRVRGSGELRGVPVRWARTCHASGAFVETAEGDLGHAVGFDGDCGWRVDESGMPSALELGDLEEARVAIAAWSGRWLREAEVVVEELVGIDGSRAVLALRARAGSRRYRLSIDTRSWLATRLEQVGRDDVSIEFADHRPTGFGAHPHVITMRAAWLVDTLRVEAVERATERSSYALPSGVPDDTAFVDGELSWRRTRGKLPLVRPVIDGRDVGWFALDTGASALAIGEDAAKLLGLPERGRRFVRTSDGVAGAPYRTARTLELGGMTMQSPRFLELELAGFSKAIGAKLAGVLGYDLFVRAVITIDVEAGVTIAGPAAAPAHAGWLPLQFEDGCPLVAAKFPGPDGERTGLFALDTGSSAAVTVTAGAAPQLASRGRARVALRGLTGAVAAHAGTLAWFELAGHRSEHVDVLVARPGPGASGDPQPGQVLGSLGMGVLKDFTTTIDVAGRRVRFVKRPKLRT